MRVTSSMYYKSIYGQNNSQLNNKLFDVNKQIASGLTIQYAKDDVAVFTETMRLDNEMATLSQIKKSTESGYKMSNQADVILNEFETSMNRVRTLLLNAANGTNDGVSLDAIASELRGVEGHFKNLANSSINGQYLFSGSAVDTRPIADDGTYMGNDISMNAFLGSRTQQQYNLTGADLFLGEEVLVKREITTNVIQNNLTMKHPDYTNGSVGGDIAALIPSDTIRDLMGDTDNVVDTVTQKHFFYIRGARSDGTAFNEKVSMKDSDKIEELLNQIGDIYGNTPNLKIVNVTMNDYGQIVVEDKLKGSSKLDFHMVGAVDFSGGAAADVGSIDLLDGGETDFTEIINPTVPPANNLHVKEFVKSQYTPSDGAPTNVSGLLYDRTQFTHTGSKVTSSISQIVRDSNAFANPVTKISEVADLSQGIPGTLDDTNFDFKGIDVNGTAFDVKIVFNNINGSTFIKDGITYPIWNVDTPRDAVNADEMSYQQLMDVMNMVLTDNLPVDPFNDTDYDDAVYSSTFTGNTFLSGDGKIGFQQLNTTDTKARMSLNDSNSGDFTKDASVMSFNANNSLTIRDPKTDFFNTLNDMITAVENKKLYPDDTKGDIRNIGIENAIVMMDDLQDHVLRAHALVGAQSNALNTSLERTQILEISTMQLRSSVIDTDLAEASLTLTQLSLNYEAMLSTVGKVSKLSLVNYL